MVIGHSRQMLCYIILSPHFKAGNHTNVNNASQIGNKNCPLLLTPCNSAINTISYLIFLTPSVHLLCLSAAHFRNKQLRQIKMCKCRPIPCQFDSSSPFLFFLAVADAGSYKGISILHFSGEKRMTCHSKLTPVADEEVALCSVL